MEEKVFFSWYPGHMKKATDEFLRFRKAVDLFIEVVDARGIISSSNAALLRLLPDQLVLKVAMKSDLAWTASKSAAKLLYLSNQQRNARGLLLQTIEALLQPRRTICQRKGWFAPKFNIMVFGLPNTGKSTLINLLLRRQVAAVANLPGWTKKMQKYRINDEFYVYDTAGLFYKRLNNYQLAAKLALMGILKRELIPLEETCTFLFTHLRVFQPNVTIRNRRYYLNDYPHYDAFLRVFASDQNLLPQNQHELQKAQLQLVDFFQTNKVFKVNWDRAFSGV